MSDTDSAGVVQIARLGAQGDGVAGTAKEPLYVPFALPGERWRVREGAAPERLSDSPERRAPICRHYGNCGGCMSQHLSDALYDDWKRGVVVEAFAHRGIGAEVLPMRRVPLRSRRRAFFGVEVRGSDVAIGFREEGQHALVDMLECPVLSDAIVAGLPTLRALARHAMPAGKSGRLIVTQLDAGLDVAFDNGHKTLSPEARARLAALAKSAGLVRLTVAGEPVVEAGPPSLTIGGVAVEPPQSIFLQAARDAEDMLIDLVLAGLPRRIKRAADLFCGIGTFTFPLARVAQVTAFDSDKRAIGALQAAARHARGLKPITATVRDLFRDPLSVRELDGFDVVVFDPPRAGAADQAERLAKSKVQTVIAVSCNPATLARDVRTLVDGGYAMSAVTPIDQFLFSPHIEAVVVLRRR